ncbi:Fanconi anemia group M protein [Pholidichthys leucotaenia]
MSSGLNQRTLFQTWGSSAPLNKVVQPKKREKKADGRHRANPGSTGQTLTKHLSSHPLWTEIGLGSTNSAVEQDRAEYGEEDDDLMVVAVFEAERSLQLHNNENLFQNNIPVNILSPSPSAGLTYPDFPGFDISSAKVWIYPTNYPIREYQLKISEAALFQNTLVCLPTGLGKTFIASVVMYNFYRWYPSGKIVFMAPTKPLVAQQIEACYKVMGIPQAHMAELTGSTAAKQRQEVWQSKRVFFLTPQVMVNDLSRDTCPAQQVKCVVIDEAHKALGNHAYCQVIRLLCSQTRQFRVLALSATPGGNTKSVQSVISNLLISHIELRSEESPDIQAHSHQRSVEKVVVPLGEALSAQQGRYLQVLEKFMSRLVHNRMMAHKDLRTLTKYQLILARDQFRKNPPQHIKGPQQGMLEGDFALCISLYHGYELLMQMGLRSLFIYFQGIMDGSREMSRAKNELQRTPTFMDLYHEMEAMFVKPSAGPDEPFIYSHPKLEKLQEVVLQHFRLWAGSAADTQGPQDVSTRVMIFSSFRESVQEIAAMLNRHAPLIKVMTFMGQASAGKGVRGFTQKEQLEVVQKFRQGGFNTLVSTCVGEEGLDIGEVDLIVCFDAQKNPTRLVQRMGRTGRKRQGRIVVILAEGREERTYNQSQSNKRSVYKSVTGNKSGFHMYPNSPRMLPDGVNPTLHKMYISCGQFDHQENSGRRSVRGRRSHSEGRTSLIHPQNLIQHGSAASNGFLSSTEYSLWSSTMKLRENEVHPTLKRSQFVSIPSDPQPQEDVSRSRPPSRELSLWEWRHWQHRTLPTNVIDHSLRCNHFIKVMELIDGMREENEGECRYEQELLPYLHQEDPVKSRKRRQKATKRCTKTTIKKPKPSHSLWSELESVDEETEASSVVTKQRVPVGCNNEIPYDASFPSNSSVSDIIIDSCATVYEDAVNVEKTVKDPVDLESLSESNTENSEDVELQAMFYLPKWDTASLICSNKLLPGREETLKVILMNVAELLSRSPPSTIDILEDIPTLPPSPLPPHQPFLVNFSLDVDDDDELMMTDVDSLARRKEPGEAPVGAKISPDRPPRTEQPMRIQARSPTWDEVFEDEDENNESKVADEEMCNDLEDEQACVETGQKMKTGSCEKEIPNLSDGGVEGDRDSEGGSSMDESIDLFGDSEAFMQMTIPDMPTPEDSVIPTTPPTANVSKPSPNSTMQLADSTYRLSLVKTNKSAGTTHISKDLNSNNNTTETKHTTSQTEPVTENSSTGQGDRSCDFFSVNFDLGYSLEDSEDEAETDAAPAQSVSPEGKKKVDSAVSTSSTPNSSFTEHRIPPVPPVLSEHMTPKAGGLPSPVTRRMPVSVSGSLKRKRPEGGATERERGAFLVIDSPPHPVEPNSDSEDEVVLQKRRHLNKVNPLCSPEVSKIASDVDSPVVVRRKRTAALNTSDETEAQAISDDDFQSESVFKRRATARGVERSRAKAKHTVRAKGRQFLDEEAALSEDEAGADISSDEEDGQEQDESLDGFVVDNTHFSQGLNDSDMHGVYLKSVRSPAVRGKFKMSYRNHHRMDIFSQVPELDETYEEDSFVVGSDEEEQESSEEEADDVEIIPEASFVDGRRQYATRRRVFLHKARARAGAGTKDGAKSPPPRRTGVKSKLTRVIPINDSSEEETGQTSKEKDFIAEKDVVPLHTKVVQPGKPCTLPQQQNAATAAAATVASRVSLNKAQRSSVSEEQKSERCRQRLENQHLLSDELDFVESHFASKKQTEELAAPSSAPRESSAQDSSVSEAPTSSGSVCILADSRCIRSGVDLINSLRQRHAATIHVCSLDGSYFIVSNRMAVERHQQSDLAATQNRKRLGERVNTLQGLFERVCLIVEKDRTKAGETSRPFQRTRYYDSTLAALVHAGIRLLWSDGTEESAGLLAELARLEQRKGHGISVPPAVKGQHRQQALQLYLSLPSVNYIQALNMSHNFTSVAQLINSPIEAVQKGGCMSQTRAEEVYRFLRCSCDSFLMNTSKTGKNS